MWLVRKKSIVVLRQDRLLTSSACEIASQIGVDMNQNSGTGTPAFCSVDESEARWCAT